MTNESVSYKTLKDNVCIGKDRFDRVENMLLAGMPDTNGTFDGRDAWVEIKTVTKLPARSDTRLLHASHNLSQEQKNWLLMHRKAGGRGFVYIDAPNRRYLIAGQHADLVNESSQIQLMLMADWTSPVPTSADRWKDLRKKLRGVD